MSDDIRIDLINNIDFEVSKVPEISDATEDAANKIAQQARNLAPVESGDYRNGIEVQKFKGGSRVFGSDWKSVWIEFGNGRSAPQAVFSRAAEAAGFKLRKGRR